MSATQSDRADRGLADRLLNALVPSLSGLHMVALLIALLLLGLLVIPVAQVIFVEIGRAHV